MSALVPTHVAAMVAAGRESTLVPSPVRNTSPGRLRLRSMRAALVLTTAALTTTVGAAFAGVLPPAAQNALADVAAKANISLPTVDQPEDSRGHSPADAVKEAAHADTTGRAKGEAVSEIASAHGKAVSAAARARARARQAERAKAAVARKQQDKAAPKARRTRAAVPSPTRARPVSAPRGVSRATSAVAASPRAASAPVRPAHAAAGRGRKQK